eukprot:2442966-Pyramimonas_sp.AAC.2
MKNKIGGLQRRPLWRLTWLAALWWPQRSRNLWPNASHSFSIRTANPRSVRKYGSISSCAKLHT